jgi:hypothetical protein
MLEESGRAQRNRSDGEMGKYSFVAGYVCSNVDSYACIDKPKLRVAEEGMGRY